MSFYRNPVIGWFLKKRILKILIVFIISVGVSFLLFYNFTHKESYGCLRPDCYSTPCTGPKCRASACRGNNCKGGDCYGEGCEAGDCEGIGCRAGNCYGLYCKPGRAIDPTCNGVRKIENKCIPFAKHGDAFSLPVSTGYQILKYLPKDTFFNPNYCTKDKFTFYFDSDRMHNFKVNYINLYTSGYVKFEDWQVKDPLQTGKSFVLTNDTKFINSIPNIFKGSNCEWNTQFKNVMIKADFKPYFNNIKDEYFWIKKNILPPPLEVDGNEAKCSTGKSHEMKILINYSVLYQINLIKKNNIPEYLKNYQIDLIYGEKIISQCENCGKKNTSYLDIDSHPVDLNSKIKPCLTRVYEVVTKYDDTQQPKAHDPINFKIFDKNTVEFKNYQFQSIEKLKTYKEHHLWVYNNTEGNTQIYKCYWCGIVTKVNNDSLPRKNNLELDYCRNVNDFNHYMYFKLDNNKTVFQRCLKCNKKSYPSQQKNI